MTARIFALIVAGGESRRMGGSIPKPYLPLNGQPVLRRSIAALASHPAIEAVQVVIHTRHQEYYQHAASGLPSVLAPVIGGATRQASVLRGLEALENHRPDFVLIHDAARPFVEETLIQRVCDALLAGSEAVLPVLALKDTLKRRDGNRIQGTEDRNGFALAQTPQGFVYPSLLTAHRHAAKAWPEKEFTDDAAIAEACGISVLAVEGSISNDKLTTPQDMMTTHAHATATTEWEYRTGNGYDVHRLIPATVERPNLWLCGVRIPFHRVLAGHSDADVGIHALVDALLGAIAAGDIGQHFPPSDMRWKNVDSAEFLRHACHLVKEAGGVIVNTDVTLVGEEPKISPHRAKMRARLAGIMGIEEGRVSVKATTTEKLGFTGRKEGLAAIATATVKLPSTAH
jgi:2-C-methyl-D-erythritol 4-phosphate cytidylyltransferase/2-C-methyl-D-erythritol 2,4-cyclodiphosphate synthase